MRTRDESMKAGKIWQVYPDINPDATYCEGTKTFCQKFIKENYKSEYKRGDIRLGKLLWEGKNDNR